MLMEFDSKAFQADLTRYVAMSKRSLPSICNNLAYHIALKAIRNTHRTPKSEIDKFDKGEQTRKLVLRARSIKVVSAIRWRKKKNGEMVFKPSIIKKKLVTKAKHKTEKWHKISREFRKIFVSRIRKKGANPRSLGGGENGEFENKASRALGARQRSRGFLASGWIPAVRAFSTKEGVLQGKSDAEIKTKGRAKGYGKPAVDGWNPVAVISNSAMGPTQFPSQGSQERAEAFVSSALQSAMTDQQKEMVKHIEDKLNAVGDQFHG